MHSFPFSTNGNFILPVAQAKTVGSTLTPFCHPIHKQTLLVLLPRQNCYLATAHTWISAKVLPLASKLPHFLSNLIFHCSPIPCLRCHGHTCLNP